MNLSNSLAIGISRLCLSEMAGENKLFHLPNYFKLFFSVGLKFEWRQILPHELGVSCHCLGHLMCSKRLTSSGVHVCSSYWSPCLAIL